jgi:hypothetical protein
VVGKELGSEISYGKVYKSFLTGKCGFFLWNLRSKWKNVVQNFTTKVLSGHDFSNFFMPN